MKTETILELENETSWRWLNDKTGRCFKTPSAAKRDVQRRNPVISIAWAPVTHAGVKAVMAVI
jgi:hypothetical protein